MPPKSQSFTTTADGGLLNVLKNQCGISQAFDPAAIATAASGGPPIPALVSFDAIWDTGATNSVITQAVVDGCGLAPIGMTQVHGVHGMSVAEVYLVNIYLPNSVAFSTVRVTKGDLPDAAILIGMDIINQGDFAVTNHGGITKFSFRVPSEAHVDFVQEHNARLRKESFQHGGTKKSRPPKKPKTYGKNKKNK